MVSCNYHSAQAISIHAICPTLSGTVPDFDTMSRCPGKYEIGPEILKNKVD